MEKLEALLDWGGTRKDVACLVLGARRCWPAF